MQWIYARYFKCSADFFRSKAIYQAGYSWYQHKGEILIFLEMIDIKIILLFWASISGEVLHFVLIWKSGKECLASLSYGAGSHRVLWIHLGFLGNRTIIIFWINITRILSEALPWGSFWKFWESLEFCEFLRILKIKKYLGPRIIPCWLKNKIMISRKARVWWIKISRAQRLEMLIIYIL